MKKKIIVFLCVVFTSFFVSVHATENKEDFTYASGVIIPQEIDWTERYILTELKELRILYESQKRELMQEVQERELSTVDKALSYSANTVNFFFVLLTILVAGFGVVGWRTIGDIKKATKDSMDRETKKIITDFQKKITELEKEQKINILWRQYAHLETDTDKLDMLNKIEKLNPKSSSLPIERADIYLKFKDYEKVIELTDMVLTDKNSKYYSNAKYLRACAYSLLGEKDKAISDLINLLQISPSYKEYVLESEYFSGLVRNVKLKNLLK